MGDKLTPVAPLMSRLMCRPPKRIALAMSNDEECIITGVRVLGDDEEPMDLGRGMVEVVYRIEVEDG